MLSALIIWKLLAQSTGEKALKVFLLHSHPYLFYSKTLPGKGLCFYMGQSSAEQAFLGSKHPLRPLHLFLLSWVIALVPKQPS